MTHELTGLDIARGYTPTQQQTEGKPASADIEIARKAIQDVRRAIRVARHRAMNPAQAHMAESILIVLDSAEDAGPSECVSFARAAGLVAAQLWAVRTEGQTAAYGLATVLVGFCRLVERFGRWQSRGSYHDRAVGLVCYSTIVADGLSIVRRVSEIAAQAA